MSDKDRTLPFDDAERAPDDAGRTQFLGSPDEARRTQAMGLSGDDGRTQAMGLGAGEGRTQAMGPASEKPLRTPASEAEERIDNYRLIERVGMGGMGEVWIAEQERPVRRRVALKLIRAGMNTAQFVARFEAERQALAMMDHPHIARVLDAGMTDHGLPFFVMELVPGVSISAHCEDHKLDASARLRLFIPVCEGVQHAHEKAILHRDIKPSNLLVTVVDGRPVPKIIDFGVAKALEDPLTDSELYTKAGALVGTLEYMSPEQLDGSGNVDTRSDVYSLGVVLYELLAGVLPFDTKDIAQTGLEEFRRRVREEDPILPSTRMTAIRDSAEGATALASRAGGVRRNLRGELDWIVMKALEKDRTRRYGSARELAEDIDRYLHHRPIIAAPPSRSYLVRKFVRRHRAGVVLGASAFVATIIAVTGLWYGLQRAQRAEAAARQEAAKSEAVNEFLQNMLASASPEQALGREVTVREILDQAAVLGDDALRAEPTVQAAVQTTIGSTYMSLGLYDKADAHFQSALDLRKKHLPPGDEAIAEALHNLGKLSWQTTDYEAAEQRIGEALVIYRNRFGDAHPSTADAINDLAVVYQGMGDFARAETMFREALASRRLLHGDQSQQVAEALTNLGWAVYSKGDMAEAEPSFREALAIQEKLLGERHPGVLAAKLNLAAILRRMGNLADAEQLFVQTIAGTKEVLGAEHSTTLRGMESLAQLYLDTQRTEQARPLLTEALATAERTLGPDHALTITLLADMGWMHRVRNEQPEAERYYRETLARRERTLGNENPDTIRARWQVARSLVDQRRYAEGEPVARAASDWATKVLPREDENATSSLLYLGMSLLGQGKSEAAVATLRDCVQRRAERGTPGWETSYARVALGSAVGEQGGWAEAESLLVNGFADLQKASAPPARLADARERVRHFYQRWEASDPVARASARSTEWVETSKS